MPTPDRKQAVGDKFASGEIQPHVSLSKAKKFFAVDASGSTEGDVMRSESDFVSGLHSNPEDREGVDGVCGGSPDPDLHTQMAR